MSASVFIVCGPVGSGKTRRLLDRCREAMAGAVGGALWLAPSQRRAEQVRALLGESGCVAARVLTFSELAAEVISFADREVRPLSEAQRRLVVDEVAADLHGRGRLRHFGRVLDTRGLAEGLRELLEELKSRDILPEQLTQGLAAGDEHDQEIAGFYAQYEKRLVELKLLDRDSAPRYARELLRSNAPGPFAGVRVVVADDFTEFTSPQHSILDAFRRRGIDLCISLPDEPGDLRSELFATTRLTLQSFMSWGPRIEVLARIVRNERPAGMVHLEHELFRPVRVVQPSSDAAGLVRIEAPGLLGESRMVAREIKTLLLAGVAADDVIVALPDVELYADLIHEVFDEYGIPVDIGGVTPLTRSPVVSTLLRAARLPDDDWPFAGVTALLRSGFFKPEWPEIQQDRELPQKAEALLRLLGIPRGRDAYLADVHRWAERQQPGLEDEDALESRRVRTHELAKECDAFLDRFFRAWDPMPRTASPWQHARWLRALAATVGLQDEELCRTALGRFWVEADQWCERETKQVLDRRTFLRRLTAMAANAGVARTPHGPGRVRVLSADLARHLDTDYLFVLGLGERGFPRLVAPSALFDEARRQQLREAGLNVATADDGLPTEMLLFYQLLTRPRSRLTLSYPAVDQRGQPLLPGSFLNAVADCFEPNAMAVQRRTMLIEGIDRDVPLSQAERRVQVARKIERRKSAGISPAACSLPMLGDAGELVQKRFHEREFTPYDGGFRDPSIIAIVQQLFGPERVFSPTALEDYAACPFRFFLRHVLRLEPLEEPREEIEVTRRGQAFHRALSRLHRDLRQQGIHQPAEPVDAAVLEKLNEAIREDIDRASGPAAKALWEIEGKRMLRVGGRYRQQWQDFVEDWQKRELHPQPVHFEVDFGMPANPDNPPPPGALVFPDPLVVRSDGIEVRISGRIDRVDLVELDGEIGFWIIDYKTGRASSYTSTALTSFHKLQLTLYALAVEEVLLKDTSSRPLGLAYWLVADTGPKVVLPVERNKAVWLTETEKWRDLREQLQALVAAMAKRIREGAFPLKPRDSNCTETCDYGQVCRITQARAVDKAWSL